ncbi:hypothetical protein AOXY_G17434 [Acipenser oxyrinchus oxyrinchus]|uniref:Uncharacterized protein n=1 Tax=Acipenser oxyrinchus oxyrinchus TaxID=40147 RepID=A0AAD8D2R8_ACIOX|nr:hypothetical protein AOXY_G17434 [Acipenser oxyrinchus oxyrinchus]
MAGHPHPTLCAKCSDYSSKHKIILFLQSFKLLPRWRCGDPQRNNLPRITELRGSISSPMGKALIPKEALFTIC